MSAIAIIPARMDSTRFPGKPMAKIMDIPMIGHIYFRTRMSKMIDQVYVATCDKEIYDYIFSIGGKAVMTKNSHQRATERVGEAVEKIAIELNLNPDFILMVQGDEPMIHPSTIDNIVKHFMENDSEVVNLTNDIGSLDDYGNRNIVKLFYNSNKHILWFFRQLDQYYVDKIKELPVKIQTGIIGFSRDALTFFNNLPSTPMEKALSVDMFRLVEKNFPISIIESDRRLFSVDTTDDLRMVEEKMKDDALVPKYFR